jgi:hypothetical protein
MIALASRWTGDEQAAVHTSDPITVSFSMEQANELTRLQRLNSHTRVVVACGASVVKVASPAVSHQPMLLCECLARRVTFNAQFSFKSQAQHAVARSRR